MFSARIGMIGRIVPRLLMVAGMTLGPMGCNDTGNVNMKPQKNITLINGAHINSLSFDRNQRILVLRFTERRWVSGANGTPLSGDLEAKCLEKDSMGVDLSDVMWDTLKYDQTLLDGKKLVKVTIHSDDCVVGDLMHIQTLNDI